MLPSFEPTDRLYYRGGHELPGLQLLKLLSCLLVVQIHTQSIWRYGLYVIMRIGVPCFYAISGYFLLASDGTINTAKFGRTLKKLLWMTLVADLLYIAAGIVFPATSEPWAKLHEMVDNVGSLRYWLLFFFNGDKICGVFWYINSYIEALLVIWLLCRLKWQKALVPLAIVGLIANLIIGSYSYLWNVDGLQLHIYYSRNFFTIALPMVVAGMLVRRYEHQIRRWLPALIVLGVCLLLTWWERRYLVSRPHCTGDIYLTTVPLALSVMLIALMVKVPRALHPLVDMGRNNTLDIYMIHPLVVEALFIFFAIEMYERYEVLVVFTLSLLLSLVFRFVLGKLRGKA